MKRRTVGRSVQLGPLSLRFVSLFIVAGLVLFYLAQSTQSATKKYQLFELRDQKTELIKDRTRLENEVTRLKSLKRIQEEIEKSQGSSSEQGQ